MKTLIICDHPAFYQSVVNRRWLDEVKKYPDEFLIHNLQSSYPQGKIDPSKEHSLLENNGPVVLQFPLYWFNSPPMMKQWMDVVLSLDWAYGSKFKLTGKKIALAVTCGASELTYTRDGDIGLSVEELLNSFIISIRFCKAEYAGLFAFYGANDSGNKDNISSISVSARNYVDFLKEVSGTSEKKKEPEKPKEAVPAPAPAAAAPAAAPAAETPRAPEQLRPAAAQSAPAARPAVSVPPTIPSINAAAAPAQVSPAAQAAPQPAPAPAAPTSIPPTFPSMSQAAAAQAPAAPQAAPAAPQAAPAQAAPGSIPPTIPSIASATPDSPAQPQPEPEPAKQEPRKFGFFRKH